MRADVPLEDLEAFHTWLVRSGFFLAGALTMLSFAPFGFFPLAPFLVLPVLYAACTCSPRAAARLGFAWGGGLFLAGTYWLYVSIHVFGEAPLILAIFLMVGLVIIMAFYYAGTAWIIARVARDNLPVFMVVAPATWVALEWLRGWVLTGFPWMTLGYSQIDSPLAGFAPVLGIFGVSLMLMISASGLLAAILAQTRNARIAFASIAIVPWLVGVALNNVTWTEEAGESVVATIVQGGVSQDRKWLRDQFQPTIELYRNALRAHGDSDLVVWPEVAIPAVLDQADYIVRLLEQDVRERDTTLLFGILERDADSGGIYNSVVATDGRSPRQIYRKRHLVPFGEYFPVPDFVRNWMRMMSLPYNDISAGSDVQPLLRMPDGNQLAVAICYEDAYAAEQLYALPDASILVNVSNDAWFGDSIAPHQHLEIARMRALEAGRYVVRATNNGVSAFIGPDGSLIETGPQFEFVTMTADITPRQGSTPYVVVGNWPVISLAFLCLAFFAYRARKA